MRAGRLDRRIRIETATITQDSHGGQVQTWALLAEVWAQVLPLRGRELFEAAQFQPGAEVKFVIRYRDDFDERARIVFEGRNYDIAHIAELGRRRGREITAKIP